MSKPNSKDSVTPDGKENAGPNVVVINILVTALICCLFLIANYFIQSGLLSAKLAHLTGADSADEIAVTDDTGDETARGVIVDLGEFTMNLNASGEKKYLKVNVALEVTKTDADLQREKDLAAPPKGGGGHGEPAAPDPEAGAKALEAEMAQFKPAIRDAIISALSSKNSDELATTAGKELAKEEIKEAVDSIFAGEREVIRVSFGQFIMQ